MTKEYYRANADKIKATAKSWTIKQRQKLRDWVIGLKSDRACQECRRELSWYMLTLGNQDLPTLVRKGVSVTTLRKAVSKCRLLCPTCRRYEDFANRGLTDAELLS